LDTLRVATAKPCARAIAAIGSIFVRGGPAGAPRLAGDLRIALRGGEVEQEDPPLEGAGEGGTEPTLCYQSDSRALLSATPARDRVTKVEPPEGAQ
jgi:hypothetical protein